MSIKWQDIKASNNLELKHANHLLTHSMQSQLQKNEALLNILGEYLIELDAFNKPKQARKLIDKLLQKNPELAGFGLANTSGQLIVTSFNIDRNRLPNLLSSPESNKTFIQALNSDYMVMGRTYYMKALREWVIPLRYRITRSDGTIAAVMTTGYKIDTPKSIWSDKSVPKNMRTIIIRKDLYLQYISGIKKSDYVEMYNKTTRKQDFEFLQNTTLKNSLNKKSLQDNVISLTTSYKNEGEIISTVSYNPTYEYYTFIFTPLKALYPKLIRPASWLMFLLFIFNITLFFIFRSYIHFTAKSKRDMQAMLDHSPAVIYIKDTKNHFLFINQKFEQVYQISRENVIGKSPDDIFSSDIAEKMSLNDKNIIQQGNTFETEDVIPGKDTTHSYMSTKFPLLDNNGNIYAIGVISTDITQRKQQEERLRNSQKMEAMGKLTGGIAHDYNNMLGVVLGYVELLRDSLQTQSEQLSYVNEIEHSAQRGVKLTQKLLSFSRNKSTSNEVLHINTLLRGMQNMLEKTLTARIKLVLELDNNICPVFIDASDMEDAILNISINAMHAIKDNGQLLIQTQNTYIDKSTSPLIDLPEGNYVVLSFTDNGCGMDEKIEERIFDPFYSTKGTDGTGLGLSQVYGFVQRSGGTITVSSEVDHGTQFSLYFPCHSGEISINNTENLTIDEELGGNETILLVDDEIALLKVTSEILERNGYKVLRAEGGDQALEILSNNTVHLLLTDIVMPNMDGFQLCALVQKKFPSVLIQLSSGYSSEYDSSMIDNKLVENLLHKPFSQLMLLKRIRELLDHQ